MIWPSAMACLGFSRQREEKMEACRIDRFGRVDGIVLRSSEDPRPGLKKILKRVRASSLNYRDSVSRPPSCLPRS